LLQAIRLSRDASNTSRQAATFDVERAEDGAARHRNVRCCILELVRSAKVTALGARVRTELSLLIGGHDVRGHAHSGVVTAFREDDGLLCGTGIAPG
jgi:hypothetical protein